MKLKVAGIIANQRKVKKLHLMIWISQEVLNETPNSLSLLTSVFTLKLFRGSDCCWLQRKYGQEFKRM